jgi:uncharacterized protein (TIGR00299 family) protein
MKRTIWMHCFAGVAGDMVLGGLIDLGVTPTAIIEGLGVLHIDGWKIDAVPVLRAGLGATYANVMIDDDPKQRTFRDIRELLENADLDDAVQARALSIFSRLANVEAALHNTKRDDVHFHEVGSKDAIVDIVGSALALELLGVDRIVVSPVATGRGTMHAAHGALPHPAPATLRLLEGVPVYGRTIDVELVTPTGAAIISSLADAYGPLPAMTIERSGYGAGTRDLTGLPNCVQMVLGVSSEVPTQPLHPVVLLEANVDDMDGERAGYVVSKMIEEGAFDAWVAPIVMKKGRPGFLVDVLCDPARASEAIGRLHQLTGSLGVRAATLDRWVGKRHFVVVEVDGVPIRMKVGPESVKAEHDDLVAFAKATGQSIDEVRNKALFAYMEGRSTPIESATD